MLSSLNLGLKTQQYFVSSSDTFLDKKTLLVIWLNPGLNLTTFWGTGARFSKVPIINGPGKLSPFTLKIEVSIVLHLT